MVYCSNSLSIKNANKTKNKDNKYKYYNQKLCNIQKVMFN